MLPKFCKEGKFAIKVSQQGDRRHDTLWLKILYRLLFKGIVSNASLLSPETLLLQLFFSRFPVDFVKGLDAVHCADLHTRGIRGGGGRVLNQNKHCIVGRDVGKLSIPTQILDICDCLFLLHYFYTITLSQYF